VSDIYEFRNVTDFLTIPADKREAALIDLHMWLMMVEGAKALGFECGEVFKWVAYGEHELREVNLKIVLNKQDKVTP
jgi:hypothetical protein